MHYIFHPTFERLSSEEALHLLPEPLSGGKSISSVEALLNALLHSVQAIVTEISKTRLEVTEGERQIIEAYRETCNLTHLLSTNHVLEQLNALLSGISTARELQHALHCALPFLEIYQNLVQTQISIHTRWTKALFKLDHVLCSTLLRLSKEGFCQPPETIEDSDGTGELLEDVEGTGLGEGSGMDNISKEIEDESQVEGLKGEDQGGEEKKNQERDGDNAVEMTEDFGSALEDVADGRLEEDDVDEPDASDNEGPEERLEDLDPSDPSALDEKIWGDEGSPQDDTKDESGKDHSEEQSGTSEMVAKENNEKSQRERGGMREETEVEVEQKEEDQEAQATEDQTKDEEGEPSTAGAPMPDNIQDTNILDIPDDIELGVGEEEQKSTSDGELDKGGEDEKLNDIETGDESLFDDELEGGEHRDSTLQDNDTTPVDRDMEMDTAVEENMDEDHAKKESIPEQAIVHSDVSPGNADSTDNAEAQDHFSTGQTIGSGANAGQRSTNKEKLNEQTEYALLDFLSSLFVTLA